MSRSLHIPAFLLALAFGGLSAAADEPALAIAESFPFTQVLEGGCLPSSISLDTPIFAYGVHTGKQHIPVKIGKDSRPTMRIPISGPASGPRAVLLLMTADPVLWDFTEAPHERIAAVILSGGSFQAALNLPSEIPLRFSFQPDPFASLSDSPARLCRNIGYAYDGEARAGVVAAVESQTGLKVRDIGGLHKISALSMGARLAATEEEEKAPSVASGVLRASVVVTEDKRLFGDHSLERLLAGGKIRGATRDEIASWNRVVTARLRTGRLAPYASESLGTERTYVVLEPFLVPYGMYGAASASFIIPPGLPRPDDAGSHNSYYFLEDGTCAGPHPDCDDFPRTAP